MRSRVLPRVLLVPAAGLALGNELSSDHRPAPPPATAARSELAPVGDDPLAALLRDVEIRPSERHGELAVHPVVRIRGRGDALRPLTMVEALSEQCLHVRETGFSELSRLLVRNACGRYTLLLSGQGLQGGRQDRMVAEHGLLPPWSHERAIPVYGAEGGRWDASPLPFVPGSVLASPELRWRMGSGSPQEEIGARVREELGEGGVSTDTARYGALGDGAGKRETAWLGGMGDALRVDGAIGAVFSCRGSVIGAELFGGQALFQAELPALLASYVGLGACRPWGHGAADPESFLRAFAGATGAWERPTYGVGSRLTVACAAGEGDVLTFDGAVVHASLFASPDRGTSRD